MSAILMLAAVDMVYKLFQSTERGLVEGLNGHLAGMATASSMIPHESDSA